MYRLAAFLACVFVLLAGEARAQLMFQTTFDKYEHPKSEWERWSQTKVDDFIEYTDGTNVLFRFEAVEVGDHELKIRTLSYNSLLPKPEDRVIRHVFDQAEPKFGQPTKTEDDKLKLADEEFAAERADWLGPDQKPIKQVWFSDDAPFDGMLKYQQYTLGKASAERVASRFRKGDKTFGKVDEPKEVSPTTADPKPKNDPPPADPKDDPAPGSDKPAARVWTSANGKEKVEAELVRFTSTSVVLKRTSDGKELTLALRQLSQADREYVQSLRKQQK